MFLGKSHSFRNTKNLEKNITALICLDAFGFAELDYERSVGQEDSWHQPKFPTKERGLCIHPIPLKMELLNRKTLLRWRRCPETVFPGRTLRRCLQIPDGRVAPSLLPSQLLRNMHRSLILQIFLVWVNVPGIALSTSHGEVKRQLIKITAIMELTL